jgi:type I restriction enzyme S subunit
VQKLHFGRGRHSKLANANSHLNAKRNRSRDWKIGTYHQKYHEGPQRKSPPASEKGQAKRLLGGAIMKWEKVKFADFIMLQRGYDLTREQFKIGDYPVVSSTTIMGFHNEYKANAPGVIIGRSGTLGEVQFVNQNYWPHNTALYVKDFKGNVPRFVYYFLKNFGTEMAGGGSAVPTLNRNNLNILDVAIPNIKTQRRIADILSAYDDLIENNQKQIKLLEEAAQRLYKEWFVDFRFPGHETTPIIDGIPQGWKKGALGDVAFFKRGKTITKNQTHEGVVPVVAGGLEPAYYHNQSNTASPVITVSGSGANAGFIRLYHTEIWASDCSFVDAQSTENIFFTFCTLKYKKGDIDALQKGAAQPHVYAKDINALEILIPTDELFANFKSFITPYFNKIKGLVQQIDLAIESRDRLLPKLMSGELEVE